MPNTRDVISNDDKALEWNGVKLVSLSRSRTRIPGESRRQYEARLDRAREVNRQSMVKVRAKNRAPDALEPSEAHGSEVTHTNSALYTQDVGTVLPVSGEAEGPGEELDAIEAHDGATVYTADGPCSASVSSTCMASVCNTPAPPSEPDSRTGQADVHRVHDLDGSSEPETSANSVNCGDGVVKDLLHTPAEQGPASGPWLDNPFRGLSRPTGGPLGPFAGPVAASVVAGGAAERESREANSLAGSAWVGYDEFHALQRQCDQQRLRLEEVFLELAKLGAAIGWARTNFPEFLHRLGIVEQQLGSAQPPRKPWLPPMPPVLHDREAEAHRLRESLDPSLRSMADWEEGRWPYCAWHLAHAQVRNGGTPLSLSLEPRDKMALDHVVSLAEDAAFGEPSLAADLFYWWVKHFLSKNTDTLEGHSLVDKFLRVVIAGQVPMALPESLCAVWPESEEEASRMEYEPRWDPEEVAFQWSMERDHYYAERAKRVAAAQEEAKRREEHALREREAKEQELREKYALERDEYEAQLAAFQSGTVAR